MATYIKQLIETDSRQAKFEAEADNSKDKADLKQT